MSSSYPQIARCSACHMYLVCARYLIGIQYHFIVRIIFFSLCIQALWISWSRISCQDKEQGNVSFGRIIMNFDSYSLIFSSSSFYYTFVFRVMSKEWLFFSIEYFGIYAMIKIGDELSLIDFLLEELGQKSASAPNFLNFHYPELMYTTLHVMDFVHCLYRPD